VNTQSPDEPVVKIIKPASIPTPSRLGVLGATFNPVTNAHLILAERARESFALDEVIFVLSLVPPHKEIFGAILEDRLAMMAMATQEAPFLSAGLSTHGLFLDIHRGLEKLYPKEIKVYFLTGRDAGERVLTWPYDDPPRALEEMFSRFELIVANRDGVFEIPSDPLITQYKEKIHPLTLPGEVGDISSTTVRHLVEEGKEFSHLTPRSIVRYIKKNEIYRPGYEMRREVFQGLAAFDGWRPPLEGIIDRVKQILEAEGS